MSRMLTFAEAGNQLTELWKMDLHNCFCRILARQVEYSHKNALALIVYVALALPDKEAAELRDFLQKQCVTTSFGLAK